MAVFTGLGSTASPSITFSADTNTGIFSPGADQVAISTNGLERLRIIANGAIGLGGANYGTNGQVLTSSGPGAAPAWQTPTGGTAGDKIEEGDTSAEVIDTGSDGRFVVTTEGVERLRIASAGEIGIAGANYGSNGQVLTSSGPGAAPAWQTPTGGTVGDKIEEGNTSAEVIDSGSDGRFIVTTEGVERLRIASAGEIGISGANYGSNGQVLTSGGPGVAPAWQTPTGGTIGDKIEEGNTSAEVIDSGSDGRFVVTTEGVERLRVDDVGRVGIDRAAPASKFDLNGNYASNAVAMAGNTVECDLGNYFTRTINSNSTFSFTNVPASRAFSFALELTHTSGTVTWPAAVEWPSGTAPTLNTGLTHLFVFVTDDGGTRWRGAALVDYNN